MMSNSSFFKLMSNAGGTNRSRILTQGDMSAFEAGFDGDHQSQKRQLRDKSDIETIRSMIQQIAIPNGGEDASSDDEQPKYYFPNRSRVTLPKTEPSINFNDSNWEEDVLDFIHGRNQNNDPETKSGSKPSSVFLQPQLPDDFSHVFQQHIIYDIDHPEDPLDRLIIPPDMDIDEDEPSTGAKAVTVGASSSHSRFFERFRPSLTSSAAPATIPTTAATSAVASAAAALTSPDTAPLMPMPAAPAADTAHNTANAVTRYELSLQRRKEKAERIRNVSTWFDPTSSLLEPRKARGGTQSAFREYHRSLLSSLTHASVATTHRNTKPDLTEAELIHFHRPRMGPREKSREMTVIVKRRPPQLVGTTAPGTTKTIAPSTVRQQQTLSLASSDDTNGSHGVFCLVEYSEEHPAVRTNYGMASLIVNFFRSLSDDSNPNQAQVNEDGSVSISSEQGQSGRIKALKQALVENKLRLPRHVMLLWQLQHSRRSYEHDADIPRLDLGQTKVLSAEDEAPFLGWEESGALQPALVNKLFRAPLFQQQVPNTDFLLIRTRLTKEKMEYVLREIPYTFACGQLEPLMTVPKPKPGIVPLSQRALMTMAIVRMLNTSKHGLTMSDIEKTVLKASLHEAQAPHRMAQRTAIREILNTVSVRSTVNGMYILRDEHAMTEEQRRLSDAEGLARELTPEEVCLLESSMSAEHRLRLQCITHVELDHLHHYLHFFHRVKTQYRQRLEALKTFRTTAGIDKIVSMLEARLQRVDRNLMVARYILDRLVFAPWNTSEAFVKGVLDKDNNTRLTIQGVGDPSGRGEGFAHVRAPRLLDDNGRGGNNGPKQQHEKLVGSDKDLRRLTKIEAIALLVSFNVSKEQATNLPRWDRIHMIREFVRRANSAGKADTLSKYYREETGSGRTTRRLIAAGELTEEQQKQLCKEIWKRQAAALSSEDWERSQREPESAEAARMARRKQRREEKQLLEKAAMLKDSDDSDSDGDEEGKANKDGGDDEDDDDDEDENLAKALLSRPVKSAPTAPSSGPRVVQDGGATSSSSGLARQVSEGEDARELNALTSMLEAPSSSSTAQHPDAMDIAPEQVHANFIRPHRVVRRIERSYDRDGKEVITIRFLFDSAEVQRVERQQGILRRDRSRRRLNPFALEDYSALALANSRAAASGRGKKGGAGGANAAASALDVYDDDDGNNDMVINLAKLQQAHSTGRGGGGGKRGNKHYMDDMNDDECTAAMSKSTKRHRPAAEMVASRRLPRVALAARFEKEIMSLWNDPKGFDFRYPVDPVKYPAYLTIVTQPVCLQDILARNASYGYDTAAALQADVDLMAANAERFNRADNPVAKNGRRLAAMLKRALEHDRKHLGPQGDVIGLLEQAVARQHALLGVDGGQLSTATASGL